MDIEAELTANVWKVEVGVGDKVTAGQTLVILDSMKMEIPVQSNVEGIVRSLTVAEGDTVFAGDVIAVIEESRGGWDVDIEEVGP